MQEHEYPKTKSHTHLLSEIEDYKPLPFTSAGADIELNSYKIHSTTDDDTDQTLGYNSTLDGWVMRSWLGTRFEIGSNSSTPLLLGPSLVTINGLKITSGTPGSGKVLTSDANGNASWVTPSSGGSTLPANAAGYLKNNGSGTLTWAVPAYSEITGKPTFATVATSGSYADLINKPTLFSGAYADLTGKPTLGTLASLSPTGTADATTYLRGDATYQTLNKAAVGLGNVDNTSDATKQTANDARYLQLTGGAISGSLSASGAYNETTTTAGLYIGRATGDTPRVMFANGTASQNWQIDQLAGTFRWFLPGSAKMTLDGSGNLSFPNGGTVSANGFTATASNGVFNFSGGGSSSIRQNGFTQIAFANGAAAFYDGTIISSTPAIVSVRPQINATSGIQVVQEVTPNVNQSGTAGYTALRVNATETAVGSGAKMLADFAVGGTSKASIDNTGKLAVSTVKLGTASTVGYVWTATDTAGNGSWQASAGGGGGLTQAQADARYLQLTGGNITNDLYVGSATGVNSRYYRVYQGPNGTAGQTGYLWADYHNVYLGTTDTGNIVMDGAATEAKSVAIQEAGTPYQQLRWWFDGSSGTGTGGWMAAPAGAPSFSIRLGDGAGTGSFNVRESGGVSKFSVNSLGNATLAGKLYTNLLQVGNTATAGYVLTADAAGNATYQPGGALPDVTVNAAGTLVASVNSQITAAGTYTAPTPAATVGTPPLRFTATNRTTGAITLSFPNPAGTTINLTMLAGEVLTLRQVSTSGYVNESGNKPLAGLDGRYLQLSGGTLTGTLTGTDLYSTGRVTAEGSMKLNTNSQFIYGSEDNTLVYWNGTKFLINPRNYTGTNTANVEILSDLELNARSIVTDTTTGLKIGTSTTQKVGFFGTTPVVQQSATADIGTVLSAFGLRASGTAYPLTTSGTVAMSGGTTVSGQANLTGSVRLSNNAITAATTLSNTTSKMVQTVSNASTTAYSVTLPTPVAGLAFWFTKTDNNTNAINVAVASGHTLDGATNGTFQMAAIGKGRLIYATSTTAWVTLINN